ncbi:MAG TPA: NAD(P)-dependent oxidoreductase [Roseiflexaceae bacterium]|nr:NAD(P)-dependent oxidoreductase [Roseiflexaceae bacterium]
MTPILLILAVTPAGVRLVERLAPGLGGAAALHAGAAAEELTGLLRPYWAAGQELLLLMPIEQALRAVAPLLMASPGATPAVVCLDEAGRLALPLLAGSPPAADALARRVAALAGGRALVGAAPEPHAAPAAAGPATTYPITLAHLRGAPVVVVGGGPVGERKTRGLLAVAADVRLVSPEATAKLRAWTEAGRLRWEARPYATGDLAGARLAFAATGDRATNAQVARDAAAAGILCNVADDPNASDFHLPAVHRTGDLTVAVSTSGTSPTRAARIRDLIAEMLET